MSAKKSKELTEDERLAQDMQLAFALQASESKKARRRQMKRATREGTENVLEDGFDLRKLNADHMVFVSCHLDGKKVRVVVVVFVVCFVYQLFFSLFLMFCF